MVRRLAAVCKGCGKPYLIPNSSEECGKKFFLFKPNTIELTCPEGDTNIYTKEEIEEVDQE